MYGRSQVAQSPGEVCIICSKSKGKVNIVCGQSMLLYPWLNGVYENCVLSVLIVKVIVGEPKSHIVQKHKNIAPNRYTAGFFILIVSIVLVMKTLYSQGRSGLPCEFDADLW